MAVLFKYHNYSALTHVFLVVIIAQFLCISIINCFDPEAVLAFRQLTIKYAGLELCPDELDDEGVGECFTRSFRQGIQPYLAKGIPELGVVQLEPYVFENISMPIIVTRFGRLDVIVHNVNTSGMSNMENMNYTWSRPKKIKTFHFDFPKLIANGEASLVGDLLGIPLIDRKGSVGCIIENMTVDGYLKIQVTEPGHSIPLENTKLNPKRILCHVHNLFGNGLFESYLNNLLKKYQTTIYEDFIQPRTSKALANMSIGYLEFWNELVRNYL